jgi:3-phenylpropionate/trans-cinnamate dioxygenase ferredoxin subunit
MEDTNWVMATNESALKANRAAVSINGKNILVIKKGEGIFAIENRCFHMNCRLTLGELNGYRLKCPCHGNLI